MSASPMDDVDPGRVGRERLVGVLLPALVHRVHNATQRLLGVRALVDVSPNDVPARCGDDLTLAARDTHDNGWLLGILGTALDADVLFAREERDGLRPTLELVRDALRRGGVSFECDVGTVPRLGLAPQAPRTAAQCLAWAQWVVDACADAARGQCVTLSFERGRERHRVHLWGVDPAIVARAALALSARLPGVVSEGAAVTVPAEWLEFAS